MNTTVSFTKLLSVKFSGWISLPSMLIYVFHFPFKNILILGKILSRILHVFGRRKYRLHRWLFLKNVKDFATVFFFFWRIVCFALFVHSIYICIYSMLRVKIVYVTKSCIYLSIVAHRATIRVYNTGLQYGFTPKC